MAPQQNHQDTHRQNWHDTKSTIHILNTIAVTLTTGRPRDVFTAAFDTHGGVTLVLAKNNSPTTEDDWAVHDLFRWITAPETMGAYDILPFLFTHCGVNIAKQMVKMDDAVHDFSHGLEEVLRHYTPVSSIDEEFPYSMTCHSLQYGDQQVPFVKMMHELLEVIRGRFQDFNLQNLSAMPDIYCCYAQLALVAFILKRSCLLHSLCKSTSPMDRNCKLQVEQLKCHLAKVCQYYHGIEDLVDHMRCHFLQGIAHCWVNPIHDMGETTVNLEGNYLGAIEQAPSSVSPSVDTLTTLCRKFPNMGGTWGASHSITTQLHTEIHILLHLSKSFNILNCSQQQPIGCSKQSSLCCTLWIWAYNNKYRTKWLTSGSHGKPYSAWALPGYSYAHAWAANRQSDVDIAVMKGVEKCLIQTIAQLFPNQRRLSDEFQWRLEMVEWESKLQFVATNMVTTVGLCCTTHNGMSTMNCCNGCCNALQQK
ncbi:hypothetical protein F5J12DRAFT_951708 [Pisolithus orientalis]|uniref:uncharacterized protein n=1 Tax=Pisolithus orientalis TaxID=936130 RepID=UPI00222426CD|nr:uncharacterized protein F5J12DRAFT_951708 [Pisolithus orientalis]KAI5999771.1 hypothetical protein F5J12DRAFT_951708 [Pisolithus orientalis]